MEAFGGAFQPIFPDATTIAEDAFFSDYPAIPSTKTIRTDGLLSSINAKTNNDVIIISADTISPLDFRK